MGASTSGQVKGLLLSHLRDYVMTRHGDAAWARVQQPLRRQDPAIWDGLILVAGWYPVGAWNRALAAFLAERGDAPTQVRGLAHFVAERDLNTVYRTLLRVAPPEFVLSRTGSLYTRYFDQGVLSPAREQERRWSVQLSASTSIEHAPARDTCLGIACWIERAVILTGTNSVQVTEAACRFDGAPHCRFLVTY